MSHLVATRPYRWNWNKECLGRMWRFGWPLLVSGLLMLAAQQADQLAVGAFLSLDALASFALATSIVSIPWFIFGQTGTALLLPALSKTLEDAEEFHIKYSACFEITGIASVFAIAPLARKSHRP
jgi:O-antigen/teichoic acid export membrane protein